MTGWNRGRGTEAGPPHSLTNQSANRASGGWFPCHEPERPYDDDMNLHDCCPGCLLGAVAAVANGEDDGLPELVVFMRERLDEWGDAAL